MRSRLLFILLSVLLVAIATGLLATNNKINFSSPNQVSTATGTDRWEPSSSVGTTWATSWAELTPVPKSVVSTWGGPWGSAAPLVSPGGFPTGDVYMNWDALQSRFVFVHST